MTGSPGDLRVLKLVDAIHALGLFLGVHEAAKRGLELLAAWPMCHTTQTGAVPINLSSFGIEGRLLTAFFLRRFRRGRDRRLFDRLVGLLYLQALGLGRPCLLVVLRLLKLRIQFLPLLLDHGVHGGQVSVLEGRGRRHLLSYRSPSDISSGQFAQTRQVKSKTKSNNRLTCGAFCKDRARVIEVYSPRGQTPSQR